MVEEQGYPQKVQEDDEKVEDVENCHASAAVMLQNHREEVEAKIDVEKTQVTAKEIVKEDAKVEDEKQVPPLVDAAIFGRAFASPCLAESSLPAAQRLYQFWSRPDVYAHTFTGGPSASVLAEIRTQTFQ